jgi:hypothetical protein
VPPEKTAAPQPRHRAGASSKRKSGRVKLVFRRQLGNRRLVRQRPLARPCLQRGIKLPPCLFASPRRYPGADSTLAPAPVFGVRSSIFELPLPGQRRV